MAVRRVARSSSTATTEAPSRGRRRPSEAETETETEVDEAPRRRRNAAADDDAPRRGRSRGDGIGDEDGDDEEDSEDLSHLTAGGWSRAEKNRKSTANFAEEFQITKEPTLAKILEDEPFSTYLQHWIEIPGKKSWICIGDDCPLCDIGSDKQSKTAFNVFDMEDGKNKILILGSKATATLQALHSDKKTGPISRADMYYAISKSGSKQQVSYVINPVKERDVKDDWGMEPLTDAELDKYEAKMFTPKAIPVFGRARLMEVAKEASKR